MKRKEKKNRKKEKGNDAVYPVITGEKISG